MSATTVAEDLSRATASFRTAGIEDSRLEAELLFAHAAGITRARLLATLRELPAPPVASAFERLVRRRLRHEPLAYITGHREFYGVDLECGPGVLIPRPETELLVELALEVCRGRQAFRVADIGAGTGAIAIAVATQVPNVELIAIDASPVALEYARRNAARAGVQDRVLFQQADLLDGAGHFDVILANLPYIAEWEWVQLAPEVREWEPREALVGGSRGTEMIEVLLKQAPNHLAPAGLLAAEVGAGQGADLSSCARACFPEAEILVRKDFAGLDRVVVVRT